MGAVSINIWPLRGRVLRPAPSPNYPQCERGKNYNDSDNEDDDSPTEPLVANPIEILHRRPGVWRNLIDFMLHAKITSTRRSDHEQQRQDEKHSLNVSHLKQSEGLNISYSARNAGNKGDLSAAHVATSDAVNPDTNTASSNKPSET